MFEYNDNNPHIFILIDLEQNIQSQNSSNLNIYF
jgi:hypothetical protein